MSAIPKLRFFLNLKLFVTKLKILSREIGLGVVNSFSPGDRRDRASRKPIWRMGFQDVQSEFDVFLT